MDHDWIIEEVDGGPLGVNDFWHCSVCGVCGGPALPWQKKQWDPFLPGFGSSKKISKDCEIARNEIRAHAEECIEKIRKACPAQAKACASALKASPDKTDIVEIFSLLFDIDRQQIPVQRVLERLKADGFIVP